YVLLEDARLGGDPRPPSHPAHQVSAQESLDPLAPGVALWGGLLAGPRGPTAGLPDLSETCGLMHGMGHLLGLDHEAESVMKKTLAPGTRLLSAPGDWNPALTSVPAPAPGAGGALPSGPAVFTSASRARARYISALGDRDALAVAISRALEA